MIQKLEINRFKSIRGVKLDCSKVNVFVGEPNSGKSNILEAISLLGFTNQNLIEELSRFKDLTDLFFENVADHPIEIIVDSGSKLTFVFQDPRFSMLFGIEGRQNQVAQFDLAGRVLARNYYQMMPVRFYKYRSEQELGNIQPGMLIHPFGQNLISVLISNGKLKDFVAELFRSKGYRFQINNAKKEIGVYYEKGDAIVSCPYNNISETLRRIIFFMACLETNAESTLVFDEPEANTFPFYTKYFAERIAQDESNQFFMTTHNPYLLGSLVEKCPATDLSVYVTYMRDFETYVRKLSSAELIELMDTDAFFNLSRFVEQNA